ncbi:STAS domain-containing protein [Bowmanella sp. JS7-9]|uniref:STAS domain-containing protein n=1 Tax=Pseudobowmanella zhangzhouensis TaxID=1537679 RepID=A0ABW1XKF1_9ALTE|nr:STAS domain-containing protein [Bowmanella sp. JS7-9]TBX22508.1 anti-anti-sigma regulatory factor [Bowmanella sp. JS7-9]
MKLDNRLSQDGTTLTIELADKFDFEMVQQFRQAYAELDNSVTEVVIDLSQTSYMDSSALGMLLNMQRVLGQQVKCFRLINCRETIRNIFQIARFDKKFDIE